MIRVIKKEKKERESESVGLIGQLITNRGGVKY